MKLKDLLNPNLVLAAVLSAMPLGLSASEYIWVEGEAPKTQSVTRHPWWYEKVKKSELSGGDFLANWGNKPGEATYEFE